MRVNIKPRHRNSPRPAEKSALGFLQWLRGRECIFALAATCEGKIEAAHLDFAGGKGMGSKVADRFCLPMCAKHHRRQHEMGWKSFMAAMGAREVVLLDAAASYWRSWPGRIAWERKQADNA